MKSRYQDPTIIEKLSAALGDLEKDGSLLRKDHFVERAGALDFIDFHLIHGLQPFVEAGGSPGLMALLDRARHQQGVLDRVDQEFFSELRAGIREGTCSREYLSQRIRRYHEQSAGAHDDAMYDFSDVFTNALLGFANSDIETRVELGPEMVFFQATPVRYILEMIDWARLSEKDVFFDLGCGLGKVLMLVSLLTGASSVGVEVEPAYCEYLRTRAQELGIHDIQVRNEDARQASLAEGTVFFMYHPFTGEVLDLVLKKLRAHAEGRPVRLCTLGRCTFTVAREDWLELISPAGCDEFQLAVFSSKPPRP
jgi:hypothetical protein